MTCALDGRGQAALMPGTETSSATGLDLASVSHIVLQQIDLLVVNLQSLLLTESASLAGTRVKRPPSSLHVSL